MTNAQTKISISRLSQYGLLSVASNDNLKFLQGQLTCDLKEVTTEQWRYGALCTNKGRMISNFLLAQTAQNQHLLRMHVSTIEAVLNTLKKFAPFYKGVVTDVGTDYAIIGLVTTEAETDLENLIQTVFASYLPAATSTKTTEQYTLVKLDAHRYECWIKKEFSESIWQQLLSHATTVDESQWELVNIRAGLGEVRKATIEEWTPHMLNLQTVGAISFKKGCYTGQEIVARTEYRGIQKRAMYRITGTGDAPATSTVLMDGEHSGGEIVMAQATGKDQWEALAVLSDKDLENVTFTCAGSPVAILDLPYAIRKTISATP